MEQILAIARSRRWLWEIIDCKLRIIGKSLNHVTSTIMSAKKSDRKIISQMPSSCKTEGQIFQSGNSCCISILHSCLPLFMDILQALHWFIQIRTEKMNYLWYVLLTIGQSFCELQIFLLQAQLCSCLLNQQGQFLGYGRVLNITHIMKYILWWWFKISGKRCNKEI